MYLEFLKMALTGISIIGIVCIGQVIIAILGVSLMFIGAKIITKYNMISTKDEEE